MSEEPNPKTKYVFQDYQNEITLWFETAEEIAEYLTEHAMIDDTDFNAFEIINKELKFKLVPT